MEMRVQAARRQEAERLVRRLLPVVLLFVVPLVLPLLSLGPQLGSLVVVVVVDIEREVDFGLGASGEAEGEEGSLEDLGFERLRQGRLMVMRAL